MLDDNGIVSLELEGIPYWWDDGPRREESDRIRHGLLRAAEVLGARHIKVVPDGDDAPWNREIWAAKLAELAAQAQDAGFDVRVVRDEPAHVVEGEIEELFSEARPEDVLLVHFSCHGLKSESGELYFAARNTRPNRLGSTAIAADFVQRCMRSSRSRSIVLLLVC